MEFLNSHIGNLTEKLNGLVLEYWPKMRNSKRSSNESNKSEPREGTETLSVEEENSNAEVDPKEGHETPGESNTQEQQNVMGKELTETKL